MTDHHPVTSPRLLLQLRDLGDQEAWNRFVQLYAPLILGFCRRHKLQDADAWDITQEVFASVCAAIGRFDYTPARGKFRSWLLTVTRRKLTDHFRRLERCPEAWRPVAPGEGLASPDFEAQLVSWEDDYRQEMLDWAAHRLRGEVTERTWRAFVATACKGRPSQEVALELGMTVGAVHIAKCRSLTRLRQLVASAETQTDLLFKPAR
ncbi:MAG: sigma-70 family RNA polymerase sigma factor [Verrucomicrobia bacterium]|jgi:RNA polymerase sigma-70 factor (ECF subfamily)|nr:sigma-70 family RNA polymerase sigma factor [Verrucomicrobiota bacterium]